MHVPALTHLSLVVFLLACSSKRIFLWIVGNVNINLIIIYHGHSFIPRFLMGPALQLDF